MKDDILAALIIIVAMVIGFWWTWVTCANF